MTRERFIVAAGRVVTCDPARATSADPLGAIDQGAVLVESGRIAAVGPRAEIVTTARGAPIRIDARDALLTPGLCDAHTHAAWVGSRHEEYAMRMAGADYEQIAARGGGIRASMRAVREATCEAIAETLAARLERMASLGVTTVEVKSGYGLDAAGEEKQLEAIAAASARDDLPRVVPTYLALHALPPERAGRADEHVAEAALCVKAFAARGLCRFVDAYVERSAFSVEQARRVGQAALEAGLGVRLHVGQFADVGGAALAAELGAASADHLEHVSPAALAALARAGTRAVLLPVASFTLGQSPPPVASMRAAGVPLVVASDANPGTAPTESLPLALAFAVRLYGLTPEEALLGATREAAASLGLANTTGALAPGLDADLVVWDLPHEAALIEPWGAPKVREVLRRGKAAEARRRRAGE